jgi:hypothetical protein
MKKKSIRSSQKRVENKLTKNDKAFIAFVKAECKRTNVKCSLRPTKWLKCDGKACSGYFDGIENELAVSMNRKDSLGILVHEYCHLTQWEDGIDLWKKADVSLEKLNDWLDGKPVRDIAKHIAVARDLELDNERRSAQMIKKWKLSIDVEDYIRRANAYVQFYNWLYYSRMWSKPNNTPYDNAIVLGAMSSKFNMKYHEMPHKVFDAFNVAGI